MVRSERVEQFFAELKRRRVIRALVAYGVAAFAVLQIIEPVMHGLHWPDAVLSYVVVALAIGFPVVVALAWAFDVKEGRIERAPAGERRGWRLAAVVLAVGVVAAAPGVVYFFVLRKPAGPEAAAPPSIAVLPFINMSSDKETDYFSDGITEELINALAHVDGLRVASRTAVFATKGKELGIQQLGQQLNVGTLLEGSVRREGNALRITAQLIKVSDGYHLWSESYDRESKGIFAIENEIARAIAGALRRKLAGVKQGTTDVAAHDLYLQGRFYWNKRTREGIRKAIGFLEEATRRDPAYALAWNGLADALTLRVEYDGARRDEVLPRAKEAARRALELDPSLGEAHASLGLIANAERDYPSAEAEYRTAIELSPNYALPHMWLGLVLMNDGRLDRARQEMERALQLDPLSLIANENRGEVDYHARNYDAAARQFRKTLDLDPAFIWSHVALAATLSMQGKQAEALAESEQIHLPPVHDVLRATFLARAGRREEALALARDLEHRMGGAAPRPVDMGRLYVALGDVDRAFAAFQQACDGESFATDLKIAPDYDAIRSDPRYHALLRCLKLE